MLCVKHWTIYTMGGLTTTFYGMTLDIFYIVFFYSSTVHVAIANKIQSKVWEQVF